MARKLRGFERVLDAPALFAVAYGEIASSLYIALGIVAAAALGLTPLVLLLTGALFFVVSLSYAEGTAAIPETGGAATFVRRAFNDLAGFVTGWVLLLDFLIVMALSALFAPHYLAEALSMADAAGRAVGRGRRLRDHRRDRGRPARRAGRACTWARSRSPSLDLIVQGVLVVLGRRAPALAGHALGGARLRERAGLERPRVRAPARDARVHGPRDGREPRGGDARAGPRAPALALLRDRARGRRHRAHRGRSGSRRSRSPAARRRSGRSGSRRRSSGSSPRSRARCPRPVVDVLRMAVGISGVLILVAAATTSVSGITRLTHSLAEHGALPRELARLERRALVSSEALVLAAALGIGLIVADRGRGRRRPRVPGRDVLVRDPRRVRGGAARGDPAAHEGARSRPSVPRAPERDRPRRARSRCPRSSARRSRFVVWVLALATHDGARYAGPAWLALGLVDLRRSCAARAARACSSTSRPPPLPPGAEFGRILVPMKIGDIGEEMVATAIALAKERGADVEAITVVRVPRRFELEGELPPDVAARVDASLEEARALGEEHGVEVRTERRARALDRRGDRRRGRASGAWTSSSSAPRRAGAGSRASSRRPWTTCCGTRRARCSWSPSRTGCSRSNLTRP